MNRRHACLAGIAAAGALAACRPGAPSDAPARSLLVSGASAMQALVQALAQAFMRSRSGPEIAVLVEPGGSLPAYIAARRGAIDVAVMTRPLAESEDQPGARQFLVARDCLRVVVARALPRTLPVAGLTQAQVHNLFDGTTANWRALGGPDLPVTVCVAPRGTPAREALEQLLLNGAACTAEAREWTGEAALLAAVAATPGAIAALSRLPGAASGATALAIDAVQATDATVLSMRYPYIHNCYLLLHGTAGGAACDFVQFARSAAGQAIVARHGLVAVY